MDDRSGAAAASPSSTSASLRSGVGAAAACGAFLWTLAPTLALVTLGTRPYVGTGVDLLALAGWLGVGVGAVGLGLALGPNRARLDRAALALFGLGWAVLAGLHARSAAAYLAAGFRPVPATGEDPAGLVLTWLSLTAIATVLLGTGALGLAVRRRGTGGRVALAGWLLIAAPAVPALLVLLDLVGAFPPEVGRLLVATNAALVPLGIAWLAVGVLLWLGPERGEFL